MVTREFELLLARIDAVADEVAALRRAVLSLQWRLTILAAAVGGVAAIVSDQLGLGAWQLLVALVPALR